LVKLLDDTWVLLPVKSLPWAKRRLSPCLSPAERKSLVLNLLLTAVRAVEPFVRREHITVISRDQQVLSWAAGRGLRPVCQLGRGLNSAIEEAQQVAICNRAAAVLVLLPDLPRVTADDIGKLFPKLEGRRRVVVAPAQRGGTNALALRPPGVVRFAFGANSCERHLSRARAAGAELALLENQAMALDIDTPEDLRAVLATRPDLLIEW
jgi:2-phospho-L-lactate guanylyltransferase